MYYKDIHRIEDALIPALLEGVAYSHIRIDPDVKELYAKMIEILEATIINCFEGLPQEKRIKLYSRLDRISNKITHYFIKHDFNTRKAFLALSEWTRSLISAEAIIIDPESDYFMLLGDMGDIIIKEGYEVIPNFEKIDASAINHVPAIHKLAQQEGYFV